VSPPLKYVLFQIPGWIMSGAFLALLVHWELIATWLAVLGFVLWLVKDLVLYPFFRRAYEPSATGSATLVGALGVAEGNLAPAGFIRVRGELWRAVASPADKVVPAGTEVEVVKAERMELFVRPVAARSGK
jgi:membrane-bound serine protease (ClpP class)